MTREPKPGLLLLRKQPQHFALAGVMTFFAGLALRHARGLRRGGGGWPGAWLGVAVARVLGNALLAVSGLAALLRLAWALLRFPRGALRRSGPAPGKLAKLPTALTHYRLRGPAHGPLVVLVHGFCGHSRHLDSVAAALRTTAPTTRILQYDNVGRGHSECRGRAPHTAALFVAQLHEMIEHTLAEAEGNGTTESVGSAGVHLVGYSMGGAIVAAFAERFPQRVLSLALIAPAGMHERSPPPVVRAPLVSEVLWALQGHGFLLGPDGAAGQWRDPFAPPAAAERCELECRLALEPALLRSTLSTMQHFAFGHQAEGGFEEVYRRVGKDASRPVLIVWGTDDGTCPFSGAAALQALLPLAELVALEGAGHCAPLEPDGEAADAVAQFVARCVAGTD